MSMIVAMMMKMTSEAGVSFHWVAHRNKNRRRCVRNYPFTKGIKVSRPDDEDGGDKTHISSTSMTLSLTIWLRKVHSKIALHLDSFQKHSLSFKHIYSPTNGNWQPWNRPKVPTLIPSLALGREHVVNLRAASTWAPISFLHCNASIFMPMKCGGIMRRQNRWENEEQEIKG